MLFSLGVGVFVGVVAYAHVTDNLFMAHETGVVVGLLSAVVVSFAMFAWNLENDKALRDADLFNRKYGDK